MMPCLRRLAPLLLAVSALFALPASAETIAITGGTLAIGDGSPPIAHGTVVLRDGRVVAAGAGIAPPAGARVIDATGRWIAAGIVAGFTDLGIVGVEGVEQTNDATAKRSPFSAALDVALAVDPTSMPIPVNRAGGVTRALVAPAASGSIFAGQGAVIDLGADMDAVTKPRAFQFVEFGETGAARAGGSRLATFALFRNALAQARDYARNPAAFDGNSKDSLLTRADAAALGPVLNGQMPLLVHVERASDILAVLALRQDYPALRLVLVGASEGWRVAPRIAAAGVPVIAAALADLPESFEQMAATQSNAGRMARAGVSVAISSVDASEPHNEARLTQMAGNLVALTRVPGATGLDWGAAFAAITSRPAEAIGMDGEIGSLRPGRRADVVLWDGDPLELASAPVAVFIDGIEQPLANHQSQLRKRYLNAAPGALPKAYER